MRKLTSLAEARRMFIRARDPELAALVTSVDATRNLKDPYIVGHVPAFRRVPYVLGLDRALANTELLEASLEQLDDGVRACRIRLVGRPDPTKPLEAIDELEQQIGVLEIWGGTLSRGERVYHDVHCYEDEVEREIARLAGTAPAQEAPVTDPSPSPTLEADAAPAQETPPLPEPNLGGRPTDRDLLLEEAEWRLRHEPRPPSLAAFARDVLRPWLEVHGEHRAKKTGEVMRTDTIEDHVRDLWNQYR
jgi:hypothetical protein